jgi:site-specific DNA-methyltransferase (adenine-specific)
MATGPVPVYEAAGVAVYCGDCKEIMSVMESKSVDIIITDPPYGTGQWVRPRTGAGSDPKAVHVRAGWDQWDMTWLDDALRVSRGPVAFFLPQTRIPDAIEFANTKNLSWRFLLWCKTDPRPRFSGQASYGFEAIIVLR